MKEINMNKFFILISILLMFIFFLFNNYTPLIADDFSLSLGINSINDILLLTKNYYFDWGGRVIGFFFTQISLFLGKNFYNIVNTFMYIFFILLVCLHISGNTKKLNPVLFFSLNVFYWIFVPSWGQNFLWLTGSCFYLWTTNIILLYLLPYRFKQESESFNLNFTLSFLMLLLGILAGCNTENTSAAVFFFILSYFIIKYIKKKKLSLFEILGFIGFLIGFIFLIAAPGNYSRMNIIQETGGGFYNDPFLIMIIKRFIKISYYFINNYGFLLFGFCLILCWDIIFIKKGKIPDYIFLYFIAVLISVYSMLLAPAFPNRTFFIVIVFLSICIGNLIFKYKLTVPDLIKRNSLIFSIFGILIISFSLLISGMNIIVINKRWQNRIEYILTERENGNMEIKVKAPIPASDRHTALYGLDDIVFDKNNWPNNAIAMYYGITSIERLVEDEPWDVLLEKK